MPHPELDAVPPVARPSDVAPPPSRSGRRVLLWTMWVLMGLYVLGLSLHTVGVIPVWEGWLDSVVNDWLGLLTVWAPAAVCMAAALRKGRRPEVVLAAAAVTSFAMGDTLYLVMSMDGSTPPFPSLADVGYLLVYPLLTAALVVSARRRLGRPSPGVWLDAAVAALGAGAVLAMVLHPVVQAAMAEQASVLATAVAVAAPTGDLVLVAAILGFAAVLKLDLRGRWVLLAAGLVVFAAADVLYSIQVTSDTYVLGTPVDAGWAMGLALMATGIDSVARVAPAPEGAAGQRVDTKALTASALATAAGLSVLVLASVLPVSPLALSLAIGALVAAGVRAQLSARLLERMAEQRRVAAATDELTGLLNRRALYAEAAERLTGAQPRRRALLMLDLDGFKEVNDGLGHRAGDHLLIQIGARLREALRGDDVLARLGGDEFAILLDDAGHQEARDTATRLAAAVADPLTVENTSLRIGVSIGIALFPGDGPDLSVLLRKADIAMYKAKASHRAYHLYCPADDVNGAATLKTVQELRTGLAGDEIVLHYQPKVDLTSGLVTGVEALARWNHPTRGLLFPDSFLNLAEDAGLMPSLTRTVLAQSLDQVAQWHADGHQLTVAVNLSASSLSDPELPGLITSMLEQRGLAPDVLQLEITEKFLLGDRDLAQDILTRLRDSGIRISVDDFGTGYNSLAYLRELPIDELKIDSSFVIPMTQDVRTAALVSSTIQLAHNLGLSTVAEGVETAGTYTELSRMGCDRAQGYFMSRPIPAAELSRWLTHWHALRSTAAALEPASSMTGAA